MRHNESVTALIVPPDPWIAVDWPPAMPRSLKEVAADAGWEVRERDGQQEVCLREHLEGRPVTPFRIITVAGRIGEGDLHLDRMNSWIAQEEAPKWVETVTAIVEARKGALELATRLSALRLLVSVSAPVALPGLVNAFLRDHLPELHGGSALIVETDQRLFHRQIAVARTLYRAAATPDVIAKGLKDPEALVGGMGLQPSDSLGGASMILPALSALSPNQLGSLATHASGTLVLLFPDPIVDPADALPRTLPELLRPSALGSPRMDVKYETDTVPPDAKMFLTWWIQGWNELLGQFMDPAIHFWPPNPAFSPQLMVGRFLSMLRMLACLQEILVSTARNEFLRMMMLFDVLDMMKGLGGGMGGYDRNADPRQAKKDLIDIETAVTSQSREAANIVLPRCRSGVDALTALRDGFVVAPADVDVEVRHLVQQLRNARHGFDKQSASDEAMKVFFTHRMDVSPDLADLAWLHMVRMLCYAKWQTAGDFRARRKPSTGPPATI